MKFFIVLAAFACCAFAAPLKNELVQRANALDQRVKAEIKRLHTEKREHLAALLEEEEKRLETLAGELKNVDDKDEIRKGLLENQLITLEFRDDNEINILQREHATQELLEEHAKLLKQYVNEEIKNLEATEGSHRHQAQEVARVLRREEQRLEAIANELPKVDNQYRIERLEVELRALEVRLYEALAHLHFRPSTPSPHHTTGHPTHATARPTHSTPKPTHATARPSTHRSVTVRPTTVRHTAETTSHAPVKVTPAH